MHILIGLSIPYRHDSFMILNHYYLFLAFSHAINKLIFVCPFSGLYFS
nr:MAG TPA: hypothetical protein [Caudoviricetes sp.]